MVLLTVPDQEIEAAAAVLTPLNAQFVGHCSGATALEPLAGHEAFSLHPLMTVPAGRRPGAPLAGAGCGGAPSPAPRRVRSPLARALAEALGMRPVEVADADRAAYHAAASIAANFLVTLEGAAERLAATAGVPRELLVPLARAALDNWAALGAERRPHRPRRARRRGDDRAPAGGDRGARARPARDVFDALVAASRVVVAA